MSWVRPLLKAWLATRSLSMEMTSRSKSERMYRCLASRETANAKQAWAICQHDLLRLLVFVGFAMLLVPEGVLSKYSNCLKSLAENVWAGHDNLGLTWSARGHSTQLSLYRRLVDLVHILVTEKSDPTKTAKSAQFAIRHPHVEISKGQSQRALHHAG